MSIRLLSSFIDEVRSLKSRFDLFQSAIWEKLLEKIYQVLPTAEGELGPELQSDIREGLMYSGVRFRTFNEYTGRFYELGILTSLYSWLLAIIVVLITTAIPLEIVNDLASYGMIFIGVMLLLSIGIFAIANLLFFLYLVSLARYLLKRARSSLQVDQYNPAPERPQMYNSKLTAHHRQDNVEISVYMSNFVATFRIVVYSLLLFVFMLLFAVSSTLFSLLDEIASNVPNDGEKLSFLPNPSDMVDGLNALIPLDLKTLFQPESVDILAVLVVFLLIFSIFLNWKKIAQHSTRSDFKWSEYESFDWRAEMNNCFTICKIIFYHFLIGDLNEEFRMIRGQILGIFIVPLGISFSYFYAIVLLETM